MAARAPSSEYAASSTSGGIVPIAVMMAEEEDSGCQVLAEDGDVND